MSQLITKYIADAAITGAKIAASGKQAVLESRLEGYRRGVLNFTATTTSDVVTTEVEAAAINDSPVASLAAKGIFTGTVTGISSVLRVIIYQTGTNQGVVDDNSDEIFGKLTEALGVFTLTYFNADGSAYTGAAPADIDFYFVEVMDMYELPADANLYQGVTGVVDADQATTLGGHLNGGVNKHDASEIDVETAGTFTTVADLETNLGALDSAIAARALSTVVTEIDGNANDLITLSGVAENATDLGTFTGSTIADASTNKAALQALETAVEAGTDDQTASEVDYTQGTTSDWTTADGGSVKLALDEVGGRLTTNETAIGNKAESSVVTEIDTNVNDLITLSGVAENASDLGTFTGSIIADASTNKVALQALETAVESASSQIGKCELITLTGTDITNKYVDLSFIPDDEACVQVHPIGGPLQDHLVDFDIITDGADNKRLSWNGLGLESLLADTDKIRVFYNVA